MNRFCLFYIFTNLPLRQTAGLLKNLFGTALCLCAAYGYAQPNPSSDQLYFEQALSNGRTANEAFRRCHRYLLGWLSKADSATGLIPRNLKESRCLWNAYDAAADNYPFMVMTAAMLDKPLFETKMRAMLATETRLTSRLGRLPDTYSLCKKEFQKAEIDTSQVIFGSAEYMKDGLIPLTEWLGPSPWSERMLGILEDLDKIVDVPTQINGDFFGNSAVVEVSGDLLQVLARMYQMTRNPQWLQWGFQIGDYYLSPQHLPTRALTRLRLRDHGCEIISGLVEMYAVAAAEDPAKKRQWQPFIHEMLDTILAKGRNEHGLFYDEINPVTGEVVQKRIADNFGYTLNAFYTVYLLDHTASYREAALKALRALATHYRRHDWENGSADGYADAIEGTLNLFLREPLPSVKEWLESEIRVLWQFQQPDGIIEGWHGDGNFARTSLMYALWKTAGITPFQWNADLTYGAVVEEKTLYVALSSPKGWEGRLLFGKSWHRDHLHLPADYPRINQFQEWYPIEPQARYQIRYNRQTKTVSGAALLQGYPVKAAAGQTLQLKLTRL